MSDKPIWERLAEMSAAAHDDIEHDHEYRVEVARNNVDLALRQIQSYRGVDSVYRTATLAIEQLIRVITETK